MYTRSHVRLRAGPGPTLCNPVATTNTDGPFRTKKFIVPKIPNDYNHHLPTADAFRLVGQAELYLLNPQTPFRESWPAFIQRCSESCHLFKPIEVAIILRTLDERKADPHNLIISKMMTSQLQRHQHVKLPGPALLTFFDVYSRRLPLAQPMLEMLRKKIPESMEELSAKELLTLLQYLRHGDIKDTRLCQKVSRKIMARIPQMNCEDLCEVSSVFGFHEYRNLELYHMLIQRLRSFSPARIKSQSSLLVSLYDGFLQNSIDPFPLIQYLGFHPQLPKDMKIRLNEELLAHWH